MSGGLENELDRAGIEAALAEMSMLRRVTTLAQAADVAAFLFLASERASRMTGTIISLTGRMIPDEPRRGRRDEQPAADPRFSTGPCQRPRKGNEEK